MFTLKYQVRDRDQLHLSSNPNVCFKYVCNLHIGTDILNYHDSSNVGYKKLKGTINRIQRSKNRRICVKVILIFIDK